MRALHGLSTIPSVFRKALPCTRLFTTGSDEPKRWTDTEGMGYLHTTLTAIQYNRWTDTEGMGYLHTTLTAIQYNRWTDTEGMGYLHTTLTAIQYNRWTDTEGMGYLHTTLTAIQYNRWTDTEGMGYLHTTLTAIQYNHLIACGIIYDNVILIASIYVEYCHCTDSLTQQSYADYINTSSELMKARLAVLKFSENIKRS